MGKHEFMSPKAIGNRIKAKGLQKLRWYCQMCQKQCRDANGFKCHTESESHQRMMLLYANNSGKFADQFSRQFESTFMSIFRRRYKNKRVFANQVYNEYIADKNHIHMNSTRWVTLSGFVQYLGKTGKARIEETPKGWYITYIERDPEELAKEARAAAREQGEREEEERLKAAIEARMRSGIDAATGELAAPTELKRDENAPTKISFSFGVKKEKIDQDIKSEEGLSPGQSTGEETVNDAEEDGAQGEEEEDTELDGIDLEALRAQGLVLVEEGAEDDEMSNWQLDDASTVKEEPSSHATSAVSPSAASSSSSSSFSSSSSVATPSLSSPSSSSASKSSSSFIANGSSRTTPPEGADDRKRKSSGSTLDEPLTSKRRHDTNWDKQEDLSAPKIKEEKKRKVSALDAIREEEERRKEKILKKDYWLVEGIVVKVINKGLAGGKYYKQKGVVQTVQDRYVGVVKMLDSGDVLKLDQAHLETVLPTVGGRVRVVNGLFRGAEAILLEIDVDNYKAKVRIQSGPRTGAEPKLEYEEVCKIAPSS